MKRLLLLPILMLGLSFACDQPYEEVAGIKIGCPLGDSDGYKGYFWGEKMYGGDSHIKGLGDGGIFNIQMILSIDGVAEGVILSSEDGVGSEVFNVLTEGLEERWGDPSLSGDAWGSNFIAFKNPDSKVVRNILAKHENSDGSIQVLYQSEKSINADKEEKEARRSNIKKGFEGL